MVAPLAGAWIEIFDLQTVASRFPVAPLAGAWIEIPIFVNRSVSIPSLPSRERGLKSALFVTCGGNGRRSPRGSVD